MLCFRSGTFDRAQCFAFSILLSAANGFFTPTISLVNSVGWQQALLQLGGVSAVCWFAFYAIVSIAREPTEGNLATKRDAAVLLAMSIAAFVPVASFASASVLLGSLFLLATSSARTRCRRIAAIGLALTGTLIWGTMLIEMVPSQILNLDAYLAGLLSGLRHTGNIVFASTGGGIVVYGPCSSLHNMSLAFILWVSLIGLLNVKVDRTLLVALAVAVVGMIAINIVRLASMAAFPLSFEYLHAGGGAQIFAYAGLLLSGISIAAGIVIQGRTLAHN